MTNPGISGKGWVCCFCDGAIPADDALAVEVQITNVHAEPGPDTPMHTVYAHGHCIDGRLLPGFCCMPETLLP